MDKLIYDWQYHTNIYCKINLMAKKGSDLHNFYSKLELENLIKYFLLFFTDYKL